MAVTRIVGLLHSGLVHNRRTALLARIIASHVPRGSTVLDIGCGDGTIGKLVSAISSANLSGIEIKLRPECKIPCKIFDGVTIPYDDNTFDVCMLVDVLHHAPSVPLLLREAVRVSRRHIILKDHIADTRLQFSILKLMDWVGNRSYGVALTYNYQSRAQWREHFRDCGLIEARRTEDLMALYPVPFNYLFARGLHFVALLTKTH